MLRKKTTLYMVNRAHVFYQWISWELCDRKESYGSFVTNIFNGTRWDDWICLSGICHMWNIWIGIIIPYKASVIKMCHDHSKHVVILTANGWPEEDWDIKQSLASMSIHVYQLKILNAQEKQENFICINFRNFV